MNDGDFDRGWTQVDQQSNGLNIIIEWNYDDRDGECERRTQNEGEWCSNFFKFEKQTLVDCWMVSWHSIELEWQWLLMRNF